MKGLSVNRRRESSIIPCLTINLLFMIIQNKLNYPPIAYDRANRMAFRDHPLKLRRNGWQVLSCLYWARKPVSVMYVMAEFNSRKKPQYGEYNNWFYGGLGRLVEMGLANESKNKSGHRRWEITQAGMIAIGDINKAALKYLSDNL